MAKLFAKSANVIVLDEPTNDLDSESLELLEEQLVEFSGTVLLVSHDREFLNNVVTSTMVLEQGRVKEYDGGYDDWLRQKSEPVGPAKRREQKKKTVPNKNLENAVSTGRRKLSYKERQELSALPAKIEGLESEIAAVHERMAKPEYYQQPGEQIANTQACLDDMEKRLAAAYQRWEELE